MSGKRSCEDCVHWRRQVNVNHCVTCFSNVQKSHFQVKAVIPPKAPPPPPEARPMGRITPPPPPSHGLPEVTNVPPPPPGKKYDHGKPKLELLPTKPLEDIAKVLEFGANKYGENNWQLVPQGRKRYAGAALRHLFAWMRGEVNDPESGLPHLAHAGCCVLFLLHGGFPE